MLPAILRFIVRYRAPLLAGLVLLGAYYKGRADCASKYRAAAHKAEQAWLAKVANAEKRGFEEGVLSAVKDLRNKEISDEIKDKAGKEPDAGAECASVDTVARLRAIQ